MMVRADVKCYYCGHVAGALEGEYATLMQVHTFVPLTPADARTERADRSLRCPRCNGPIFLESVERLRPRAKVQLTAADFAEPFPRRRKAS